MTAAAFECHESFERTEDGFAVTAARFAATVAAEGDYRLRATLPTLDAVVVGESVADVVEDGWFDTFQRRVTDIGHVTAGSVASPTVSRGVETVTVEVGFESDSPADDALALLNFIEGTWVQGIVPGYDYREDVQRVRDRARQRGEG